ncbi:Os03g0378350 [Oryza sativa Japonica Group]|uniref:Os03g0378350 protein n=1 Tax=Oryza sativa subsp. japonica TaxID=39947 RepID=A0A0P0VY48_ORYSJ|nr:Os03g0378350 [Oryza sativa Japonica Group]
MMMSWHRATTTIIPAVQQRIAAAMRMPQPHRKGHRHVAYAMQRCNLELTLHPAATVSHIAIAAVVMNPNLAAAFLATTLAVNLSVGEADGRRRMSRREEGAHQRALSVALTCSACRRRCHCSTACPLLR